MPTTSQAKTLELRLFLLRVEALIKRKNIPIPPIILD